MSLEKAIEHGKEKRKPYFGSGRFDHTCRPGGSCPYCQNSRMYSNKKKEQSAKYQEEEVMVEDLLPDGDDVISDLLEEKYAKVDIDVWDFSHHKFIP